MMSITSLLSDSFNFICNRRRDVLLLVLIAVLLDIIISILGWYFLPEAAFLDKENFSVYLPNLCLSMFLLILARPAIKSSIMLFLKRSSEGENLTAWGAIKGGMEFYRSFLALELLVQFTLCLGSMALLLPIAIISQLVVSLMGNKNLGMSIFMVGAAAGLTAISYLWLSWLLAPAIVIAKKTSAIKALAESRKLSISCRKQLIFGSFIWSLPIVFFIIMLFWNTAVVGLMQRSSLMSSWFIPSMLFRCLISESSITFALIYNFRLYMQLPKNSRI